MAIVSQTLQERFYVLPHSSNIYGAKIVYACILYIHTIHISYIKILYKVYVYIKYM